MSLYTNDITPVIDKWIGGTVSGTKLTLKAFQSASCEFSCTEWQTSDTALVEAKNLSGTIFVQIRYSDMEDDSDSTRYNYHTVVLLNTAKSSEYIALPSAIINKMYVTVYAIEDSSMLKPAVYVEQFQIASADVEYALWESCFDPPDTDSDRWQTECPQWGTNEYVWYRIHMTYTDGHDEYSYPVCMSRIAGAGILSIQEYYYLSTSSTECVGGSWSTTCPVWQDGCWIWVCNYVTYTNQVTEYTDPVLATTFNTVEELSYEAVIATENLDAELWSDGGIGTFRRLTNNGLRQGVFINESDDTYYINATYIQTGIFYVGDRDSSGNRTNTKFYANIDDDELELGGFTYDQYSRSFICINGDLSDSSCQISGFSAMDQYVAAMQMLGDRQSIYDTDKDGNKTFSHYVYRGERISLSNDPYPGLNFLNGYITSDDPLNDSGEDPSSSKKTYNSTVIMSGTKKSGTFGVIVNAESLMISTNALYMRSKGYYAFATDSDDKGDGGTYVMNALDYDYTGRNGTGAFDGDCAIENTVNSGATVCNYYIHVYQNTEETITHSEARNAKIKVYDEQKEQDITITGYHVYLANVKFKTGTSSYTTKTVLCVNPDAETYYDYDENGDLQKFSIAQCWPSCYCSREWADWWYDSVSARCTRGFVTERYESFSA